MFTEGLKNLWLMAFFLACMGGFIRLFANFPQYFSRNLGAEELFFLIMQA